MKRPDNGLPEDLREHARLMCDIIAMAFQTDKTRVASLILARDLSALYYPFLDVREAHHGASHNDTSEGYERIARFHLSSSPIWRSGSTRCPKARARCSTTAACCTCRTCSRDRSTTTRRCR